MAVETIYLSVVVRQAAAMALDEARWEIMRRLFAWQPTWFREDEHLAATTFMNPREVRRFGEALEARTGLMRGADWVVVDMQSGPLESVPWLAWRGGPNSASGAWLQGTQPGPLAEAATLLPGFHVRGLAVCQMFGMDHPDDTEAEESREARGLPTWGGHDLWLVQDPRVEGPTDEPPQWCGFRAGGVDFMTL